MKFSKLLLSTLAASALLVPADALAEKGAPHTFTVSPNFSNVQLSWLNPTEAKQLKWHDDRDYDGDSGVQTTTQAPAAIYVAAEFTPADLALVKGEIIESLNYFEYRPVVGITAIIWEDGKIVREQKADMFNPPYTKNSWRTIKFDEPYELKGDKTIRFGFKIDHGSNMDFVAIMNSVANSKGDLRSYDGKKWVHNGRGTYLITANLVNKVDEAPASYNVYVDGVKVNDAPCETTDFSATAPADGSHKFKVESVYESGETYFTPEAEVTVKGADSYFPSIAAATASTTGVNGSLEWEAPLLRTGNELTWSTKVQGKNDEGGLIAIGGTATSNTKVWIKNEFEANDLLQFRGSKITAINGHFTEAEVTGVTVFVMKDDVIVYYEVMPEDVIATIAAGEWTKFPLATPVEIEDGHKYAYGYYLLQTPKKHPVSVDNTLPMSGKANSFSTSSPNSSDFTKSKPSWRTLASGNITGQWMLTADLEGGAASTATSASYTIIRNGETIASDVKTTNFADEVPNPGTYTYGIVAVGSDGKTSAPYTVKASYKLPDSYRAPLISSSKLDKEAQTVSFAWSMDVEMKHYSSIAYKVGFDEDMSLTYGARFTSDELADYEGYSINALTFIIGDNIADGFKLQIQNGDGNVLWEETFPASAVTPQVLYQYPLDTPVKISGNEDLYLAYVANLKGGTSPIILDAGPLVTGGAVVKFTGAPTWLNLGTINSTYNNYNIVIGAVVSEPSDVTETSVKVLGNNYLATLPAISAQDAKAGFGLDGGKVVKAAAPRALKPAQFNVFRNGEHIATTADKNYVDQLNGYDTYTYTVSAIYPNGWESAESDPIVVENNIRQAAPAPYDLKSEDGKTLTWSAPENAPVLTYAKDGLSYGVGMTGTGTRETFAVNKFEPEALKDYEGKLISHIKFALYTTDIYTASVVIFKDFNIIYEQEVNVADLKAIADGYNEVSLNKPIAIEPNSSYMIGYHITYANGIKPMIFDEGPANDNYGNLLSASAGDTSWKSLKSMNASLDGNWRIYATLANPKGMVTTKDAEAKTYNIYLDGKMFKSGITTESYTHSEFLPTGEYTVTAGEGDNETAHSNGFYVENTSGVDEIIANDGESEYFNLQGVKVDSANLAPGVYIRRTTGKTEKVIVK